MPELPEVEALTASLTRRMAGGVIERILVRSVAALKTHDPPPSALQGRTIARWHRHGKFLDLEAPPLHLVVHLARAGWIRWVGELPECRPAVRGPLALQLRLADGSGIEVTEHGHEKRLAVYVAREVGDVPGIARLGLDVLDPELDEARLAGLLRGSTGQLKGALSDQSVIAGVGNAYSDEVLHAAKLSPYRAASSLSANEIGALHAALRDVIGTAVERARSLDPDQLKPDKRTHMRVHGRTGLPCPACGDTIREVSFASRSFQYCPTCQTGGRVLADRRLSRLLR